MMAKGRQRRNKRKTTSPLPNPRHATVHGSRSTQFLRRIHPFFLSLRNRSSKFNKNNHTDIVVFKNVDPNVPISASRLPQVPHDVAMLAIPHLVFNSCGKMAMEGNGETLPQSTL
ncbi:hypothetical protein V6N11_039877 [Hibiscus sabdariffa]|uniref:Uncharacterized protein n=1 Tax=Hibiscus sabdariffa TaxID=183260 RepID=A0ABR2RG14_9ROSI